MPTEDECKPYFNVSTEDLKLIADYTNMGFNELLELDCVTYKRLFKDAFIYRMKQSEKGQEYLEQCWILTQTAPDKESLRNRFKGGGE